VEDFLTPTAQMRFKFIASDSLRPEVNLNGGSLVEAAMDDFTLYDEFVPQGVEADIPSLNWSIFPNVLTTEKMIVTIQGPSAEVLNGVAVYNSGGQLVQQERILRPASVNAVRLDRLNSGYYWIQVNGDKSQTTFPIVVINEK
jgi:hypothetical protein